MNMSRTLGDKYHADTNGVLEDQHVDRAQCFENLCPGTPWSFRYFLAFVQILQYWHEIFISTVHQPSGSGRSYLVVDCVKCLPRPWAAENERPTKSSETPDPDPLSSSPSSNNYVLPGPLASKLIYIYKEMQPN